MKKLMIALLIFLIVGCREDIKVEVTTITSERVMCTGTSEDKENCVVGVDFGLIAEEITEQE